MAQILSPSILSSSLHIHFHGHWDNSCNNCCPPSPKRVIAQNDLNLVLDTRSKIATCLARCFCCCTSVAPQEQNKIAVSLYERYLVQEYGEPTAKLAIGMAHIDLAQKKATGSPLFNTEASAISDIASRIVLHRDTIKKMLKHLAFYSENAKRKLEEENLPPIMGGEKKSPHSPGKRHLKQKEKEEVELAEGMRLSPDEEFPDSPPSEHKEKRSKSLKRVPSDPTAVVVQKRDGKLESFQPDVIARDLSELPLDRSLTEKEIKRILREVNRYLRRESAQQVSSDTLRSIVAKEIETRGVTIPRPEFLDQIPNKQMAANLERRRGLEDISAEECEALLSLAAAQEHLARREYVHGDREDE